jgi:hypothetical protein
MTLIHRELSVILNAYLLAAIPLTFAILAGAWSPLYRQPWSRLARWWSWMALGLVASAIAIVGLLG